MGEDDSDYIPQKIWNKIFSKRKKKNERGDIKKKYEEIFTCLHFQAVNFVLYIIDSTVVIFRLPTFSTFFFFFFLL